MWQKRIRPLVIGVFRRGDEVLVFRGKDTVSGTTFYQPLGGSIEFGEYAHEALAREIWRQV